MRKTVRVRRNDETNIFDVRIDEINPTILRQVLNLDFEPSFMVSELTGLIVLIKSSDLTPGENYIVNTHQPDVEIEYLTPGRKRLYNPPAPNVEDRNLFGSNNVFGLSNPFGENTYSGGGNIKS